MPRQQTPRYHLRSNPYPVNPHHELLEIQEPLPEPNLPTIAQVLEEAMDQFNQPEPQYLDHIAPPAAWEQEEINYQVIAANYQFPIGQDQDEPQDLPPAYDTISVSSSEEEQVDSEQEEMEAMIQPEGCLAHLHQKFSFEIQMAFHLVQCNAELEPLQEYIDLNLDDFDWSQAYIKRIAATRRLQRVHDLDAYY